MRSHIVLLAGAVRAVTLPHDTADTAANAVLETELSPRAFVAGNTFDRFVQIFLENQDYVDSIANPDLAYLAKQGRLLTNYYATTHPSQPNYVAAVGGSTNGVTSNSNFDLAPSVKTIVDVLEPAGISWGVYQEHMPSTGFTGDWPNQETGSNDYVRKHNPVMSYRSVTDNPSRMSHVKNFTLFFQELADNQLPQWMFITPNMTNDGHDTNLAYGANWARNWIMPLLSNPNFNSDRTLVILTYDEGSYNLNNQVYAVLLGSALSAEQVDSTDGTQYNHYSLMKTAEQNWALGNLGAGDVDATAIL